nr:MAG TPA: CBD-like protein [Caudoviricetes sp.]
MRILDENNKEITSPDLSLGYIHRDRVLKQYHNTAADDDGTFSEEGHWETVGGGDEIVVKNDGKDEHGNDTTATTPRRGAVTKIWIPDRPSILHEEEYEEILRYTRYSTDELEQRSRRESDVAAAEKHRAALLRLQSAQTRAFLRTISSDADVLSLSGAIPEWDEAVTYVIGDIVRMNNNVYRAGKNNGPGQQPTDGDSVWRRIGEPNSSDAYPWVQPLRATDAYDIGEKVSYGGGVWESTIHWNVWLPGTTGWKKVSDDVGDDAEWVRPLTTLDAYIKGAEVRHNNKHWVSDVDKNVCEPGVSQWTEVKEK